MTTGRTGRCERVAVDDERAVSDAGVVLVATLASG
jgi:hypothetical protein